MATTSQSITTAWTPPSDVTGLSATPVEELSHVQVDWDVSDLADVDFDSYTVQRREADQTEWETLEVIVTKAIVQHIDVFASQGVQYEYKVIQAKKIPGDAPLVSGDGDIALTELDSDAWFVVGDMDPLGDHVFELPVADEQHSRIIQQEVFEPIASNRKKVVRGNTLGYEGSLQVRWMDTEIKIAKSHLNYLANNPGPHLLKSPFGDTWKVEFDSPDYRYRGGGHLDIEIGWVEVL